MGPEWAASVVQWMLTLLVEGLVAGAVAVALSSIGRR